MIISNIPNTNTTKISAYQPVKRPEGQVKKIETPKEDTPKFPDEKGKFIDEKV